MEFNAGSADFQITKVESEELRELAHQFRPSRLKAIPWTIGLQK
ncbi:MAG: hypothetical protein ACTSRC_06685 [Candidatus Helarchaeota archaeon]